MTTAALNNIEDQFANADVSTNEELWDFFIEELDMTAEQADAAVALRPEYLGQIFLTGHSLLFRDDTVSFDPNDKKFKSDDPLLPE